MPKKVSDWDKKVEEAARNVNTAKRVARDAGNAVYNYLWKQ